MKYESYEQLGYMFEGTFCDPRFLSCSTIEELDTSSYGGKVGGREGERE